MVRRGFWRVIIMVSFAQVVGVAAASLGLDDIAGVMFIASIAFIGGAAVFAD